MLSPAMAETAASPAADEVTKYKIHIPTKHLDLTRQKLELTRLPHEGSYPASTDAWAPAPLIEPLIDFWLEHHSWRAAEARLNTTIPQFRTAITPPGHTAPIRIHFIHARSPCPSAIPLLLIPPFPLPSLALERLIRPLTTPPGGDNDLDGRPQQQAFHLVIPSLPGTAFSDPLPTPTPTTPTTATTSPPNPNPPPPNPNPIQQQQRQQVKAKEEEEAPLATTLAAVFAALMRRLGYARYLASTAAPGWATPGRLDEMVLRRLLLLLPLPPVSATTTSASAQDSSSVCVGGHLIAPALRLGRRPPPAAKEAEEEESAGSGRGGSLGRWVLGRVREVVRGRRRAGGE